MISSRRSFLSGSALAGGDAILGAAGVSYLGLSASWKVAKNVELRAGVNNPFDKDPPIVSSNVVGSGAANSFPTYDQLGRQLYAAFTARF